MWYMKCYVSLKIPNKFSSLGWKYANKNKLLAEMITILWAYSAGRITKVSAKTSLFWQEEENMTFAHFFQEIIW